MSQTISAICTASMSTNLKKYGEDVARSVIEVLSAKYGFDEFEAMSAITLEVSERRGRRADSSRPTSRSSTVSRSSAEPSSFPIPFCGQVVDGWCCGVRPNGGLYTQCSKEPVDGSPYCDTCKKQAEKNPNNLPNGGDIGERKALGDEWRDPKGKAPVRLANYLKSKKMELTAELRQNITEAASGFGFTIADDEWAVKQTSRGRPRKTKTAVVDTTATEDEAGTTPTKSETVKRKKGASPKSKLNSGSESSDGEELVLATPSKSSLVKRRSMTPPSPKDDGNTISPIENEASNSISPVVDKTKAKKARKPKMTAEEKEAAKEAKAAAKLAEKEAAKAAKLAEKEAEKAAKLAEKEAAKAAKLAEKEAAKAAKLAEKEADKAAKAAAKLAEKEADKAAKAAAKLAEKEAAKAAKLAEKEAEKEAKKEAEKEAKKEANAAAVLVKEEGTKTETAVPAEGDHDVYEAETDEGESDDDSGDDAAGVEEFEHKGKKYLRDPSTNDIFDHAIFMETGDAEEIGVYDPNTDEIDFHE